MDIVLPQHIAYEELRSLLAEFFDASLAKTQSKCAFNWRKVQWVNLPELVGILSWSAKLVDEGREVVWLLPSPVVKLEGLADARQRIRTSISNEVFNHVIHEVEKLKGLASSRKLRPGQRRGAIRRLINYVVEHHQHAQKEAEEWLDSELGPLIYQDILGFFWRYKVFEQASNCGIQISPDPRTLASAVFERGEATPCLELRSIRSSSDISQAVEALCDPKELQRILGSYSQMDLVSRGALAHILVNELGRNVEEHAHASAAWLCTRLVKPTDYTFQIQGDPVESRLARFADGFLEVIVSDNGIGLAKKIAPVMKIDPRRAIAEKYKQRNGEYAPRDLVDYAFDRLASSKRDIADLVHWDTDGDRDPGPLASGLYWIWNLMRSHEALLEVRSSGVCGCYDFSGLRQSNPASELFQADPRAFNCCGTMIRICLPITKRNSEQVIPSRTDGAVPRYAGREEFLWVGHLARDAYPSQSIDPESQSPLLVKLSPEVALFRRLQREHAKLRDRGILVLNLCGARELWTKHAAAPLCHFFLHFNYTGPAANSAVILWNVPIGASALFEQGIELARRRYGMWKELHRVALLIYDNGATRLICGSAELEKALGGLALTERLSFDELNIGALSAEQREQLHRLISQNTHLFHRYATGEIGLLGWREDLRGRVWQNDMAWLEQLLDTDMKEHGLRQQSGKLFFRLPSSGLLVKTFYSFTSFLCNQENCARIAWLLHQLMLQIEKEQGARVRWVVAVTRSASPLAQHLFDNYLKARGADAPELLFASTIEDLERQRDEGRVSGTAIFVTDVISTGKLSVRVSRALQFVSWLGTVSILDTWSDMKRQVVTENAGPALGINYIRGDGLATGPALILKHRAIDKLDPMKFKDAEIIAIDPVNVMPVARPEIDKQIKRIWPFLTRTPDALSVGHFCSRGPNHYIYFVSIETLLTATWPDDDRTLRDLLLEDIGKDLRNSHYHPNYSIILHPPKDESEVHFLADLVQDQTDILYKHVLHRDSFANQQRFSTSIEQGGRTEINQPKRVAIVLDDGANTGETLMGLIDAAALDKPSRVLAYCALARLPLYKLDFFGRMDDLGRRIKLSIKFATRLTIPVYSRPSCPICRFAAGLDEVIHRSPLLSRYAVQLRSAVEPVRVQHPPRPTGPPFIWKSSSPVSAGRLREAIELAEYYHEEHKYVIDMLAVACQTSRTASTDSALLNVAFVVACEPDLLAAPLFAPHLARIEAAIMNTLRTCPADTVLTLFALGFYVAVQYLRRGYPSEAMKDSVKHIVEAFLARQEQSITGYGQLFAACLAEFWPESDPDSPACHDVCVAVAETFRRTLSDSIKDKKDYVRAFGCFLTRELLSDTTRDGGSVVFDEDGASLTLFDYTKVVAAKFWWHASTHCEKSVDRIVKHSQSWSGISYNAVGDAINDLCLAFNSLQELRRRINLTENALRQHKGVSSSANLHWKSEHMSVLLDRFATGIALLAEALEKVAPNTGLDIRLATELEAAWQNLKPQLKLAFDDIYPQLCSVAQDRMHRFVASTQLPHSALLPADIQVATTDSRVFVPSVVLESFFDQAMRNLLTSAYANWTEEQKSNDAIVKLSIKPVKGSTGDQFLEVVIADNGPIHNGTKIAGGEHGRALLEIDTAVREYGGRLDRPTVADGFTNVRLLLRHRVLETQE